MFYLRSRFVLYLHVMPLETGNLYERQADCGVSDYEIFLNITVMTWKKDIKKCYWISMNPFRSLFERIVIQVNVCLLCNISFENYSRKWSRHEGLLYVRIKSKGNYIKGGRGILFPFIKIFRTNLRWKSYIHKNQWCFCFI